LWATYFHGKSYVLILSKNGLGYILRDFLKQTRLVTLVPICPRDLSESGSFNFLKHFQFEN
jgi:hypothetical protein